MKSTLFVLCSLVTASSLSAVIYVKFSLTPQAAGADLYGLDGSVFTFTASSSQETYGDFGGGAPYLEFNFAQLTISGSSLANGTYNLSELNGQPFIAVPNIGDFNAMVMLDSTGGSIDFGVGSLFEVHNLFLYSQAPVAGPVAPGDTIVPEDFDNLVIDGAGLPQFTIRTPSSGVYTFNFEPFTVSATAAPVPEPQTYAALAGLATLGWVALRRKRG